MSKTHKAILLAETQVIRSNMNDALAYIGAPNWMGKWLNNETDNSAHLLSEFMGRLCYKSFELKLNPNVTRVREGNREYLGNILKQKHGSIFEHASVTFLLFNVSRILTHELVRHRAGTAYSQESQRFVRLDDFQLYIPDLTDALREIAPYEIPSIDPNEWVEARQDEFVQMSEQVKEYTKGLIAGWLGDVGIDAGNVSFHVKKQLTSALRRLLPGGVNTNIGITANHRTWRHILANRTASGAEIEIIEVMNDVGTQLQERYPNIYQDMLQGDSKQLTFQFEKI